MKFKLCVLIFSFLLCNCFAYSQTKLLLKVNKCIKAGDLSEATEIGNPRYFLDLPLSIINVSVNTRDIVGKLSKVEFE